MGGNAGDTLDSAAATAAAIAGVCALFGPVGLPGAAFFGGVAIGVAGIAVYAHATEH